MTVNSLIKLPTGYWLLIETESVLKDDISEIHVHARLERFLYP